MTNPQTTFDDDEDDDPDPCDHEDAEIDILTGLETCHCGWSRYLTSEELKKRAEIEAEAYELYCQEMEEATKQEIEKGMPEQHTEIKDNEIPF